MSVFLKPWPSAKLFTFLIAAFPALRMLAVTLVC